MSYTGEIFIALSPLGNFSIPFRKGERIAQLIPMGQSEVSLNQVKTLEETVRGAGGFGSSGSN